jgi:ATP-dependent DNA helicase RecQ
VPPRPLHGLRSAQNKRRRLDGWSVLCSPGRMTSPIQWPTLRPFQQKAVDSLHRNSHTLLMAPTGAGKSLIFQRYLHENASSTRAVLVTPLVALGRQQVARFGQLGIRAACGVGDSRQVQFPDPSTGVWVVSPERLVHQEDRLFEDWKPNFFIFDEAHCVFDWGEEFRPAFNTLRDLFQRRCIPRSFWCSATLRQEMIREIVAACGEGTQVLGRFEVPRNITLRKDQRIAADKLGWTELFLARNVGVSGIIYTNTRSLAERLAEFLRSPQRQVWVYHAGMSAEERMALEKRIEAAHQEEKPFVVIATSAFGMGMDYPKLRFAILFDPPYSILQLAQALGRVGRSGIEAQAHFLWNAHDFLRLRNHCRGRPRALAELDRLERWYRSTDSPCESLEKDFRDSADSGNLMEDAADSSQHDSHRRKRTDPEDALRRSGISRETHLAD